jgi:hypothetical protein
MTECSPVGIIGVGSLLLILPILFKIDCREERNHGHLKIKRGRNEDDRIANFIEKTEDAAHQAKNGKGNRDIFVF